MHSSRSKDLVYGNHDSAQHKPTKEQVLQQLPYRFTYNKTELKKQNEQSISMRAELEGSLRINVVVERMNRKTIKKNEQRVIACLEVYENRITWEFLNGIVPNDYAGQGWNADEIRKALNAFIQELAGVVSVDDAEEDDHTSTAEEPKLSMYENIEPIPADFLSSETPTLPDRF